MRTADDFARAAYEQTVHEIKADLEVDLIDLIVESEANVVRLFIKVLCRKLQMLRAR